MEKTRKLVLFGDSAFAEIAREYFEVDTHYEVVGYVVEQQYLKKDSLGGLSVTPFETMAERFDPAEHDFFAAVVYTGLNRLRTRIAAAAKAQGYKLAQYVSPRAFVWRNVKLGEHCFIFEDNTVQPFVEIGDNVVLWSGNHIGHHSKIRDNCFIASHVVISGFCDVGENSFLGVNVTVANNIIVAKDNWIGPAITLSKNTNPGELYSGTAPEPSRVSALRFFKVKE